MRGRAQERGPGGGASGAGVGLEAQEPPGTGRVDGFVFSGPAGVKLNQLEQLGGFGKRGKCAATEGRMRRGLSPSEEGSVISRCLFCTFS